METPTPSPDEPKPPRRGPPLAVIGAVVAVVAGGAIAWSLMSGGQGPETPPPASEGGLVIDSTNSDDGKMDPGKPLRCFVQGRFVGEISLTDCARRNGVATDALDVGIDESGALAAADAAAASLIPLPPTDELAPPEEEADPAAEPAPALDPAVTGQACWRHAGGRWRRQAGDWDLNGCVQTLFAGRCERPGRAAYGRFGQQTLRLVEGRVEVSDDNRTFRNLVPQNPDCSLPPVG